MSYNPNDYVNAATRVRTLEVGMVDAAGFARMLDAKSAEEAYKVLSDSALCQNCEAKDCEQAFDRSLAAAFDTVEEIAPDRHIVTMFRRPYDGHNLKVFLKASRLGSDYAYLYSPLGTLSAKEAAADLEAGSADRLGRVGEAALQARDEFARTGDPQTVDILIDKGVLEAMAADAAAVGCPFVLRYAQARVDIANLRAALRLLRIGKEVSALQTAAASGGRIGLPELFAAYQQGTAAMTELIEASPYGEALRPAMAGIAAGGTLTELDRLCDNCLAAMLQQAKSVSFGAEPVAAFLAGKELEVQAARIILTSKQAGVSREETVRRLRDTFI